jgi:hypothetical protein
MPDPIRLPYRLEYPPDPALVPAEVTEAFNRYAAVAGRAEALEDELRSLPAAYAAANEADGTAAVDAVTAGKPFRARTAPKVVERYEALVAEYEALRSAGDLLAHAVSDAVAAFADGPARSDVARAAKRLESTELDKALEPVAGMLGDLADAVFRHEASLNLINSGIGHPSGGRWPERWQLRRRLDVDALLASVRDLIGANVVEFVDAIAPAARR